MTVSAGRLLLLCLSTRRSFHCRSLLVSINSILSREVHVCVCSGEPSRKAGSPKLHPSKPGGTFVGSNARQVEVEMKEDQICALFQSG